MFGTTPFPIRGLLTRRPFQFLLTQSSLTPSFAYGRHARYNPAFDGQAEAMNMLRKGQIRWLAKGDVVGQAKFIQRLFGVAA